MVINEVKVFLKIAMFMMYLQDEVDRLKKAHRSETAKMREEGSKTEGLNSSADHKASVKRLIQGLNFATKLNL